MQKSQLRRLKQAPDVVGCKVDDGNALLDLSSGEYYRLNSTGTLIWECIGEGLDVHEIAERVVSEYDVEYDPCLADVLAVCNSLLLAGLVAETSQ